MMIKDWWDRLMRKLKGKEERIDAEPVMSLEPSEAPEPVPERKTSDEVIIAMAESAARAVGGQTDISRSGSDGDEPDPSRTEEAGSSEEAPADDVLSDDALSEDALSEETLYEEVLSEDAVSEEASCAYDPGTEMDEEDTDENGQEC